MYGACYLSCAAACCRVFCITCWLQRAWRCFYARLTLYYLRQHKKHMKLALKEADVQRIGSVVVPRRLVRQQLRCVCDLASLWSCRRGDLVTWFRTFSRFRRKCGAVDLASLSKAQRDELRAYTSQRKFLKSNPEASLMGVTEPGSYCCASRLTCQLDSEYVTIVCVLLFVLFVCLFVYCFTASRYSSQKVHAHTHTYTQTHTDTHKQTRTHAHTHAHIHKYADYPLLLFLLLLLLLLHSEPPTFLQRLLQQTDESGRIHKAAAVDFELEPITAVALRDAARTMPPVTFAERLSGA